MWYGNANKEEEETSEDGIKEKKTENRLSEDATKKC